MRLKGDSFAAVILLVTLSFMGCSNTEKPDTTMGETVIALTVTPIIAETEAPEMVEEDEVVIPEKGIAFSKTKYFYSEDIAIKVLTNKSGEIYYTTDGTDPTKEKIFYMGSITLKAGNTVKATCIKAKEFYSDGTESDTIVHTYFLGKEVVGRFDTLVFSITTDPYNLYDNEYGIFVEGKLRTDYIAENPNVEINPDAPANYNMRGKDSEREVYLEIISSEGIQVIGQEAGIRTYGGWSRAREQKSIKIYARKEYDEQKNKFDYVFFPEKTTADGKGNILDSFKQIVLRNCGNDNGFGFIRDELFQTLAGQAGYQDYEAVRPATLYVNGDYRGFFWLHEVYGDEYFSDHYGDYEGEFEILEGGDAFKNLDTDESNTEIVDEYDNMYYTYANMDLTVEANYEKVCEVVDVKNYLEYFALQTYISNEDWPHNNYKTYRYYVNEGEKYGEAPFDGKWRYLIHDLDYSFGIYGTPATTNTIANYIGQNGEIKEACPLFSQLMRRTDCQELFIKKTLDLMNGTFASKNMGSVLDEMNAERLNELNYTYDNSLLEDWVAPSDLSRRIGDIKNYGMSRASYILTSFKDYFGLGKVYQVKVESLEGCKVKINSFVTDQDFIGSYYSDYNTEVTTVLSESQRLDYWIVNGEKLEEDTLIITSDMVKGDLVDVSFVLK